jgi:DNA polymerase-3 subunit beta
MENNMKLIINQKVLEKALVHANWIIERKQAVPILGYILVEASTEAGLKLTATNMDMTIVDLIECEVLEGGRFCLPAGLLLDIIKKMKPGADIVLEHSSQNNAILVTSNRSSFSINYMDPEGFPPIANTTYDVEFSMNTGVMKDAINIAKVAMLQDNTRFHLNGIHMHPEGDKLRFVATDLYRIACVSISAPVEAQSMPPIIVSKRTVGEVLKLIDASSEEVKVSVSENRIAFSLKSAPGIQTEFSARLINGTFPEYKAAIEVMNDKILSLNTEDFIEAIDRVSTVVLNSSNSIKLHIQSDKMVLSGISHELGSAEEEVDVVFNSPEPFDICFNSRYLLEVLKEITTPQVKVLLATSSSSTIIQPDNSEDNSEDTPDMSMIFAVMPVEIVQS